MMLDLNAIVMEAQLSTGASPYVMMARSGGDHETARISRLAVLTPNRRAERRSNWTADEERFVDDSLGTLSYAEIGQKLGRTPIAIKIRQTRLGMAAPSHREDALSVRAVADLLGMCGKKLKRLIHEGKLPAQLIPGEAGIHVIYRRDLLRWLVQPDNFLYIMDTSRIAVPEWRSLVERRMALWGDEWWTTGQVGQYHGVPHTLVNKYIHDGKLPGVRWNNWRVKKSDAIRVRFVTGRGTNTLDWSAAGDAFLVLGRAVGLTDPTLDFLRKEPTSRAWQRLKYLDEHGQIARLIKAYDLPVHYYDMPGYYGRVGMHRGGHLFADWRDCADRFPALVRAVRKFHAGRPLTAVDKRYIRGVLHRWANWFADTEGRYAYAHRMVRWQNATTKKLHGAYRELLSWGIDPLGGDFPGGNDVQMSQDNAFDHAGGQPTRRPVEGGVRHTAAIVRLPGEPGGDPRGVHPAATRDDGQERPSHSSANAGQTPGEAGEAGRTEVDEGQAGELVTALPTAFDAVLQGIVNKADTVQIQETAVDRYYLAKHHVGAAAYEVDVWDGLPAAIRRVGVEGEMTRGSERPSNCLTINNSRDRIHTVIWFDRSAIS